MRCCPFYLDTPMGDKERAILGYYLFAIVRAVAAFSRRGHFFNEAHNVFHPNENFLLEFLTLWLCLKRITSVTHTILAVQFAIRSSYRLQIVLVHLYM